MMETEDMMIIFSMIVFFSMITAIFVLIGMGMMTPNPQYGSDEFNYINNMYPSEQCENVTDYQHTVIHEATGSMRPVIQSGNTALLTEFNESKALVTGDIVLTSDFVMHRVVAIYYQNETFWTKGDNNPRVDKDAYKYEEILYIVCGVLY